MRSLRSDGGAHRLFALAVALLALVAIGGCIADTAEDSDLPWATNQGWEGMIPIPAGAASQYD